MRTQPQAIIEKLEADNSRLAKESIIQSAMEEGLDAVSYTHLTLPTNVAV